MNIFPTASSRFSPHPFISEYFPSVGSGPANEGVDIVCIPFLFNIPGDTQTFGLDWWAVLVVVVIVIVAVVVKSFSRRRFLRWFLHKV